MSDFYRSAIDYLVREAYAARERHLQAQMYRDGLAATATQSQPVAAVTFYTPYGEVRLKELPSAKVEALLFEFLHQKANFCAKHGHVWSLQNEVDDFLAQLVRPKPTRARLTEVQEGGKRFYRMSGTTDAKGAK